MRAQAADNFGAIANLALKDLPKPAAGPGELLIQVKAVALNPADLYVLNKKGTGAFIHAAALPHVPCFDFSGVVTEVGAGADKFKAGDEVFGFLPYVRATRNGTCAEFVAVKAGTVALKPKSVSHEQAAASATVGVTSLQAFRDKAGLKAGQSVLVNGASGGVGTYAVQVARVLGGTVSGICSAGKAEQVKALGAERIYDYKTTPISKIAERFDVILDAACNSSFTECAALLNPGGTYVVLLPSPGLAVGMVASLFTSKRCRFLPVSAIGSDVAQVGAWLDEGKIKPVIDSTYPLAELPKALERLQSGNARGKVAVTIDGN